MTELKTFDAEEEKGPFSFFKKSTNKINAMKAKYDKAEVNVNKICDVLDGHQRQLLKRHCHSGSDVCTEPELF